MKVLLAASEAVPFIKVGGLADVIGALPKALLKQGVDVRVVIPYHSSMAQDEKNRCTYKCNFSFYLGWRQSYCGIFTAEIDGVIYYLIDNERYFKRAAPYGEFDDGERYAFFSKAILEILPLVDFWPDIIHTNDWHTALVPVYLDSQYRMKDGYRNIKTIFTIHNIEFQGKFGEEILEDIFGIDKSNKRLLEYGKCLNCMKGAIECANIVTTVSENYAHEILNPYFSFGLHNILKNREYKIRGIINGIDTDFYNPETDVFIKTNYSIKTRVNKKFNKIELQRELLLPENNDVPIIGMVTRLTPQKGLDLIEQVAEEILKTGAQLVILGTGYAEYENYLHYLEFAHRDSVRSIVDFSPSMAQKIYAGADLFLMPSKAEPCGLSQLIALRYGTIPIVHAVGGLYDTIKPFIAESGEGCGVTFQSYDAYDMLDAIHRAIAIWFDKDQRRSIMANAMEKDVSWDNAAKQYIEVYESV